MPIIHIYGASGSGTSTLAKAIGDRYGYRMLDSDDYFWLPTNPPYSKTRSRDDRCKLMKADIIKHDKVVISGSLCGWGDEFIPFFDLVIRLVTPTDLRVERLKQREYAKFGERVRANGDMHENHLEFLRWAERYDSGDTNMRSKALHDEWQKQISCRQIVLDGSKEVDLLLGKISCIYPL